jgi:parallel beta-helix repeat protein
MKALYKVILIIVIACAAKYKADAQVFVSDTLTSNTTWYSNQNPYIVVQDLIVPKGITLTIMPGVMVKSQVETSIKVYGTLVAMGTLTAPILFTENSVGPDIQRWSGIKLLKSQTLLDGQGNYVSGTIISNARIEGTTYSITIDDSSSVLIEKCEIDNSSFGIYLSNSNNNIIRNCSISNSNFGIFIPMYDHSSYNLFSGNLIHDNSNVGLFINNNAGLATHNIIEGNQFDRNPIGLYIGNNGHTDAGHNIVRNNVITNSSICGLQLYQDSTEVSENLFYSNFEGVSILKSKFSKVLNNLIFHNQEWGIVISGPGGYNTVEFNNIYDNLGAVLLSGENGDSSHYNSIVRNSIHNNQKTAVRIETAPQAGIQFNNIFNNGTDSVFVNQTRAKIHAEYNWWGTVDTTLINKQIYDIFDDQGKGLVIYKPFAGAPGSTPPISAPRNVVKKLVGGQVEVSWIPNLENDLKGYRVYYNYVSPFEFADYIDVNKATHYLLDGVSVFDTIAVTAYDSQADGSKDQFEGHESDFSYALLGPYAGADTAICYNNSFLVSGSNAFEYSSLIWTTSGDGLFSDVNVIHPVYIPGVQDKISGEANLTLSILNGGIQLKDEIRLILLPNPVVDAGNNSAVVQDSSFLITGSIVKYYDSLLWLTSGDGHFNYENALHAIYSPGISDIAAGQVTLTLNAFSPCGLFTDDMTLNIIPSYSISGKVHAGNSMMNRGSLSLLRKSLNGFEPLRSGQIQSDGSFRLNTLTTDEYLLYVTPDPVDFPDYLPTYYVGKLSWKEAYLLPVNANTFDLDIYLAARQIGLPKGVGSISGICTTGKGSKAVLSEDVQNLTIFLLDGQGKNILEFVASAADGTFRFPDLPYGEYILQAEKAGYESPGSSLLRITPESPDIPGVHISLTPQKNTISIELRAEEEISVIKLFPDPVSDVLHVAMPKGTIITSYAIIDAAAGHISSYSENSIKNNSSILEIDVKKLSKGFYTLIINDKDSAYHCSFLKL